jgi:apolipoprotein N-acyltransferase
VLALLSGALLGAAFLPAPLGFLAWFGFVPLLIALEPSSPAMRGRELFGLGYAFGLIFFLIGTHWIALLSSVAITIPWLKYPAWIFAAAYLALFPALATWATGTLARRARLPLALTFPIVFLVVEELRASGELGFPWFQPGYTQHAYVPIIQMASLGSVSLITAWLLVLNVLVWRAVRGSGRALPAIAAILTLLLPWAWGSRVLDAAPRGAGPSVALIQANIAGEIKWEGHHQKEILDAFLRASEAAARVSPPPSIVIWPETATGSYLRKQLDQTLAVLEFTARTRIPLFSGFADYAFDSLGKPQYRNAAGLFEPGGMSSEVYAKRHLVPFGERMPFQRLFPGLGKIELGQAEWTPGTSPVLFPSAAGRFGCLVCFEAIFPDLARDDVRRGARWLVNVTNDEWFGNSSALHQHAAMAVLRAVENHVPLARCANTGLTLLADANGRVTATLPVFRPGVLVRPLPLPGRPTPFTSVGDWPGMLAWIGVVGMAARAIMTALTARARHG